MLSIALFTERRIDLRQGGQGQLELSAVVGVALDRVSLQVDGAQALHNGQLVDLVPFGDLVVV